MNKHFICATLFACLATVPAHAGTVVNGDFETGDFSGYEVVANNSNVFGSSVIPDSSPYASVEGTAGNSFAELRTQPRSDFRFVDVIQSIALTSEMPIIGFDLSDFTFVDDGSPNPGTTRQDTFYFGLEATFDPLISYTGTNVFGNDPSSGGLAVTNFATANDIGVTFVDPLDSAFRTRVLVDFSNYALALDPSNPLTYEFSLFSQNDGYASTVSFDNVGVQARAMGAVPEPTTWAMMLLGFFAICGAMRRNIASRSAKVSYA